LEAQVGRSPEPEGGNFFFTRTDYMSENYKPFYGPSIEMTKEWFDRVMLPMREATSDENFTPNIFEALLNSSILADQRWIEGNVDDSRILLE
jgi:hypothetical protein